ncbi:MAG: TerB N-terminal domain-containing protein [Defluviitaleaceae bacterium]|nr:TerB N-terminal domain-containing protein [Defluviitaleaceae bacterium]
MDNKDVFAEIEYEVSPPIQARAVSQQVKVLERDPVKDKFMAMRRIFYDNPYSRNDAELFYKQMKYMEDYEDNYPGNESFSMYHPSYQFMSYEQLRTYFTWRSNVRRGQYAQASLSYIFVHIYELLANIGAKDPVQGLSKFLELWQALRKEAPVLDKYISGWLKDYHIYYGLDFTEFVEKYSLTTVYPENYLLEATEGNCLDLWNAISGYNIEKSQFYKGEHQELIRGCFYAVINSIKVLCASKNTKIETMLTYEMYMSVPWRPFSQASFFPWLGQPDRKVSLPGGEVYYCKYNTWTTDTLVYHTRRGEIAGYIIKKTEEILRKTVGHKHQLTAYTKTAAKAFRGFKKIGFTRQELDKVIEKTVTNYHKSTKRTVVTVDTANLNRIRTEAQDTQDLLVVPETPDIITRHPSLDPGCMGEQQTRSLFVTSPGFPPIGQVEGIPGQARDDGENPWANLKTALTPTEIQALHQILQGNPDLKTLGTMPEVLLDSINEKAADHIGDNILDQDFTIYDDYIDEITEMVE